MALDAYLLFKQADGLTGKIWPKGEGMPGAEVGSIFLGDSWSFSLENILNITPHTGGVGAGKAKFETFTIKKQVDTASPDLFEACGAGAHFDNVLLKIRKSTGNTAGGIMNTFLTWTFSMFAVEKLEWSHGDPSPEETVSFKFGKAILEYKKQNPKGQLIVAGVGKWDQIAAQAK